MHAHQVPSHAGAQAQQAWSLTGPPIVHVPGASSDVRDVRKTIAIAVENCIADMHIEQPPANAAVRAVLEESVSTPHHADRGARGCVIGNVLGALRDVCTGANVKLIRRGLVSDVWAYRAAPCARAWPRNP